MNEIITKKKGHILLIELNRTDKMNAFSTTMLLQLGDAFTMLEDDSDLRCGLLYTKGKHFTAGLDLQDVSNAVEKGIDLFPPNKVDAVQLFGRERTKPMVVAAQGNCYTIAIELILAADICVANANCKFGQIEIKRGIFPFGGATIRFPQRCGWGNAMRYLLTGDFFDTQEAFRMGLVQEISDTPFEKALEIATRIAQQAPLGVQATIMNARQAMEIGKEAAVKDLMPTLFSLMNSEDAKEGMMSFIERRNAKFTGK